VRLALTALTVLTVLTAVQVGRAMRAPPDLKVRQVRPDLKVFQASTGPQERWGRPVILVEKVCLDPRDPQGHSVPKGTTSK
jgi:hypothetical protein